MEKFIKQIGKKAGEMLLKEFKFNAQRVKQRSGDKGFHTKNDFVVERFLIKEIKKKYPNHSILGEELGEQKKQSDYFWILDPLDGTNNFVNHNPFFAVSIALLKNNKPYLSYIYAPFLKEEYFAQKGKGTFRNGKKIRVSSEKKLKKSNIYYCEGGLRGVYMKKRVGKIIFKLYPNLRNIRKLGAASIECAWVATGRVEGYFSIKIPAWDVAAGVLLIQEAGGKVTNFQGKSWQPIQDNFIASNGKIHSSLLKLFKNL